MASDKTKLDTCHRGIGVRGRPFGRRNSVRFSSELSKKKFFVFIFFSIFLEKFFRKKRLKIKKRKNVQKTFFLKIAKKKIPGKKINPTS